MLITRYCRTGAAKASAAQEPTVPGLPQGLHTAVMKFRDAYPPSSEPNDTRPQALTEVLKLWCVHACARGRAAGAALDVISRGRCPDVSCLPWEHTRSNASVGIVPGDQSLQRL